MKKQILFLLSLCATFQIVGQQIADPNFAQAIRGYCPACLDNANRITEEGQKLTGLTVSIQNINDITGIAGFSSLVVFNCGNNNITFLPPLPSRLRVLFVSYNKLTSLDNLPDNLGELYCVENQLKRLPDSLPSALRILNCSYNALSVLPKMPTKLQTLLCSNNLLTKLPVLPQTLEGLVCANNALKSLPNLPKTLSLLSCQNNNDLTCLPRLPDSLAYLYISKGITCLPNIVKKAIVENYEGVVSRSVNLPICTNFQLAFCPPIAPDPTEPDKKIHIYPNPTEGVLKIRHDGLTIDNVLIFNYLGQLVRQSIDSVLDLSLLASGWYFVQVKTKYGTTTEKIVKQ